LLHTQGNFQGQISQLFFPSSCTSGFSKCVPLTTGFKFTKHVHIFTWFVLSVSSWRLSSHPWLNAFVIQTELNKTSTCLWALAPSCAASHAVVSSCSVDQSDASQITVRLIKRISIRRRFNPVRPKWDSIRKRFSRVWSKRDSTRKRSVKNKPSKGHTDTSQLSLRPKPRSSCYSIGALLFEVVYTVYLGASPLGSAHFTDVLQHAQTAFHLTNLHHQCDPLLDQQMDHPHRFPPKHVQAKWITFQESSTYLHLSAQKNQGLEIGSSLPSQLRPLPLSGSRLRERATNLIAFIKLQQREAASALLYLGLAGTVYICCIFGDFPARNTVYTLYIYGSGQSCLYRCNNVKRLEHILYSCNDIIVAKPVSVGELEACGVVTCILYSPF
jgi:hypothetical protein